MAAPLDRPVGPAGRPLAGQPMLVEPVPHRGRVHPKLVGDAGACPSPGHRPVGKVVLQRREAQLCGAGGEVLVGGGAPPVGGGYLAGGRGDACLVEQAADERGGGVELAGQLRGLASCWQRAWR